MQASQAFATPSLRAGLRGLPHSTARIAFGQPRVSDQPSANERGFARDGRVETVRPGEYLLWNFDIGQDRLKTEHQAEMARLAQEINSVLSQNPDWQVDVEGEASPSGNDAINDPLSARRAGNVRSALVTAGVDTGRIQVTSTGSRRALPDVTAENQARSRAVRIILAPRLDPTAPPLAPPAAQPNPTAGQPSACTVLNSAMTLAGDVVHEDRTGGQYKIVAGSGASAPGMIFAGVAEIGTAGCGTLEFVQNVQPFRELIYKDGSRLTMSSTAWALDTSDPYPSQVFPGGSPTSLSSLANDSPEQGIGGGPPGFTENLVNTLEIRDVFRMFMLLRRQGGARQTLQVGTWTFIGLARTSSTGLSSSSQATLSLDTSVSRIIPTQGAATPTAQAPVLSPNVTSVPFQLNRGGMSGVQTFADLFFSMVNGRRRSPGGPSQPVPSPQTGDVPQPVGQP